MELKLIKKITLLSLIFLIVSCKATGQIEAKIGGEWFVQKIEKPNGKIIESNKK